MVKNLALIAASFVAALLIAEAGLRIAGVSYPSWYAEDPDLGGVLRPGAEGWFRNEGHGWVRINRAGMRDAEHSRAKPPGTLRIAVLGDSFAEAMPVNQDQAFWSVLGRRLNACGSRPVEVLNFGVSGYGTAQELIMLRRRVWQYDPDIVLLAFFTGNDVRNNDRVLNQDPAVPYFTLDKSGRLVEDDSFRQTLRPARTGRGLLAALRDHSQVLQLVAHVRGVLKRSHAVEAAQQGDMAALEKSSAQGGELGVDDAVYAPPRDARWEEAWRITEALILAMRDEVRARGKQLWVVTLSTGIQVHPDAAVRQTFMKRLGIDSLYYPDRRVAALCEREGIPVITLAPELAAWAQTHKVYLHGFRNAAMGFGHWNETGNRLAGELIAERMCAAWKQASITARRNGD